MDITLPTALKTLSTAEAATKSFSAWLKSSRGDARALIAELKHNLYHLELVVSNDVPLARVIGKLAVTEYTRLSRAGYNFNKLKRARIADYPWLRGTDLAAWAGKDTESLIESIYDKLDELVIKFPLAGDSPRFRWTVRVNNIRKRILLLLRHVAG